MVFQVYQALGLSSHACISSLACALVVDGRSTIGLLGRDRTVNKLAVPEVTPLVVRAVPCRGVLGAAAARPATDLHALDNVPEHRYSISLSALGSADPLAGLLDALRVGVGIGA